MNDFKPLPDLPPPPATTGVLGWLRANLFSSTSNTLMTLLGFYLVYLAVPPLLEWAILEANFLGTSNDDCTGEGACWVFVKQRLSFFVYGFYPPDQQWRLDTMFTLLALTFAPQFFDRFPFKKWLGIFALTGFPLIGYVLISGGMFGLEEVPTGDWGGIALSLVLAYIGIVASLPIGVVLALGRRSTMPVIRTICVVFIEFWRAVPLISILFMSSVMLPLFLPDGMNFDKLLRALIGIIMFQSAYMAEVIRGGLQAIPRGQYEAADALGLSYWKSMRLIILPQALKMVIPGIVNTFIALFKDTTLVLIIGLLDVLGAVNAAMSDPAWGNVRTEAYLFAGAFFWVFCFSMSRYSQNLEKKLHTGHKR